MQTDVIHLMPFFSFFSGEKRAGGGKKQRDLEICFFLFVCLSLARLRLLFSLVPRIYLFFSSPSSSQKFSILLLLSTLKKKEPPHSFAFFVRIALLLLLVLLCFLLAVVVVVIAST